MMIPLGKFVTNAGTLKQISTSRLGAYSIMLQVLPTNTGLVYIGSAALNRTTLVGAYAILPVPTTLGGSIVAIPSFTATVSYAPAALNAQYFWFDVDVSGEGVIATLIQG